jgi:PAS domain S-box-containing protein
MALKTVNVPKEMEPLFAKAEEVVSAYFGKRKMEPEKGTIEIFGERYIMVRAAALSVEFFDLVQSIVGDERKGEARDFALNILFDLAHAIGKSDAKNFHNKMNLLDPVERLSAGPVHFSHSGWAYVDIFPESRPTPDENYYLIYDHPFSFESDAWEKNKRKTDFPVCIMNAGYSSGWCEESFGVGLVAHEILCKAKGDDCCRFIMAPPLRIEGHIKKYAEENPGLAKRIAPYEMHDFFKRQREAEERVKFLSSLVEQSGEGIAASDLDGHLTYVNQAFAEMHNCKFEDLIGKHLSIFHTPDQMEAVNEANRQMMEKGDFSGEIWHARCDGTTFPTYMHNTVLKDDGGRPVGMVGTVRDMTERKKAEDNLRQSEEKYSSLFQHSNDAIFIHDLQGNIIDVNHRVLESFGYTKEEVLGLTIADLHPPGMLELHYRAFEVVRKEGFTSFEIDFIRKDGSVFQGEVSASILEIGGEKVVQGIVRDITERKKAEEALRESEERFRLAFENAKDAIFWANPETGKILNCNRAAEILLEKDRDEIIGQFQGMIHPPEKVDHYARMFASHLEKKGASDDEAEVLTKTGRVVPVSITASITKVGGEDIMQGIFRDITERKKAQEQLQEYSENLERMVEERTAELDRARAGLFHSAKLAAMGRMGAGIAHQLNSPICSGLLYLDSLAEDFENEPERAEIHEKLKRSLLSMKEAIDSTLSMAMQPRLGQPVRDWANINDILGRVLSMAEVECHRRKVVVHRRFAEGLPRIEVMVGELDQAFINIINNAIDSMEKGGDLTIETSRKKGGIDVRITDTGKGIPAENIEQIFEPFFTTRMAERGIGLGLSIAREIVDRYKGEISVESTPGKGSVFAIRLPAK